MIGIASGRYTVERGEATDSYGDESDAAEYVKTGILGSIAGRSITTSQPNSGRATVVSVLMGRFAAGTDLRAGDRLTDERTGAKFVVLSRLPSADLLNRAQTVVELQET